MLEKYIAYISDWIWTVPATFTLVGGGLLLMLYSAGKPLAYIRHAVGIMQGKYDKAGEVGEISHYQALAGAISATVGMGNISGVAVAIATGGPGALFWMWVCALLGMVSKFFECALSIMYRKRDAEGNLQGGPMYYMEVGIGGRLGKRLGITFAIFGLVGCLPLFTANQLTEAILYLAVLPEFFPAGGAGKEVVFWINMGIGAGLVLLTSLVILGGIKRVGEATGYLFPIMVGAYMLLALWALGMNVSRIPAMFSLILTDAFSASALQGGALGTLIIIGIRRAAFSNEAGVGTSPMMHGAAKTDNPVREGLVAMLGPFIDTIVICTITGFLLLLTDTWQAGKGQPGIHLTIMAVDRLLPVVGRIVLLFCAVIFALTTLFSYSYYGTKCFTYLFGNKYKRFFLYFYLASILFAAVNSLTLILSLIDLMYALMVLVNVPVVVYLSPQVLRALQAYKRD